MTRLCFYCGVPMTIKPRGNVPPTGADETIEHVIPQALLRLMGSRITLARLAMNKVFACHECNAYKGRLSPLDWLVIMPSNEGASRLGELLMRMGCTIDEVADAMGRRKK